MSRNSRAHRQRRQSDVKMDTSDRTSKKPTRKTSDEGKKGSFARKVVVHKGPNAPADNRKMIKVANIPYDLTWKDVKGALSDVGTIERCDVERGEATLTFASHKDAQRAIQTYDGGDMNGRKIRVFFA